MSATDSEPKPGPSITLKKLHEILDQIATISLFSSINLRERIEAKYVEPV